MKYLRIIGLISFFLLTLVMSGCHRMANLRIDEVTTILNGFDVTKDLDISYTTKSAGKTINSQIVVKTMDTIKHFLKKSGDSLDFPTSNYYLDGYVCKVYNGHYDVSTGAGLDIASENPVLSELDLKNLKHDLNIRETAEDITYIIDIKEYNDKSFLEKMTGETISEGNNIGLNLEITALKSNKQLKAMKIIATISRNDVINTIERSIIINAMGSGVDLVVPSAVTQAIEKFKEPKLYEDTTDGIVKYHDIGLYKRVIYDAATDKLAVLRRDCIEIYNMKTMEVVNKFTDYPWFSSYDVDNGRLIVCNGSKYFRIYDLSNYREIMTVNTTYAVKDVAIDGNMVMYTDDSVIVFHNINTNECIIHSYMARALFTINRKDHILYATETDSSSTAYMVFNTQSGEKIMYDDNYHFTNYGTRIIFDGKYIHHENMTFNRFTGWEVSRNNLSRFYVSLKGFTPFMTLHEADNLSIVASTATEKQVAIYDNKLNKFVYKFPLSAGSIQEMGDGVYLGTCTKMEYIAIFDVGMIDETLVNDDLATKPAGTIETSDDGLLKSFTSTPYTHSIVDDKYIYTLNKYGHELKVYDIETLAKVYSATFTKKPVCLDAYGGKLVIGFGNEKEFWIYDTTTWEYESVTTAKTVFTTLIYQNTIIYVSNDDYSNIMVYDTALKTHSNLGYYGTIASLAINRNDEVLYIGDKSLVLFDLKTKNIHKDNFYIGQPSTVRFDGLYVHYRSDYYDKVTGVRFTERPRTYPNLINLSVIDIIYDDNNLSILKIHKDGEFYSIVYDLETGTNIYMAKGQFTGAYRVGNTVAIMSNATEMIKTINLDATIE